MENNSLGLKNLRLGHDGVDAEHGVQVQLVESLQAELRKAGARGSAVELLERLLVFSDMHFGSEELLMRLHSYPGYAEHVEEHRRLLAHLRDVEARLGEGAEASALVDELRRWLGGHIAVMDRDFAEHARSDAIGPG